MAQLVKNPPAMWETWVQSLGWEDLLVKGKVTHSNILLMGGAVFPAVIYLGPNYGGNGTPLQYSCLENPMDGEVW